MPDVCPFCKQPLPSGISGRRVFVYDEARAILDRLTEQLGEPGLWMPLSAAEAIGSNSAPPTPGVYRLRFGGEDVYVGKTRNLLQRLSRHANEFRGREGLELSQAECTYVVLPPPWDVRTSENVLIDFYERRHLNPWNNMGFGANDPGRNRDRSTPSRYHREHPAKRSFPVSIEARLYRVEEVLRLIKEQLPYLLRYQSRDRGGEEGWSTDLQQVYDQPSAYFGSVENFLVDLCRTYLTRWQLTYLPVGYILYRERTEYPSGIILYQRP